MHYETLGYSTDVAHHNGIVSQVVRSIANPALSALAPGVGRVSARFDRIANIGHTLLYVTWRGVEILPNSNLVGRSGAYYHTVGAQGGN